MSDIKPFDPKTNKFPYPLKTDEHYLIVKKNNGLVFDENYAYIDKSFKHKFIRFWVRLLIVLIIFPLLRIRLGLRLKGRKNLRKHKDEIKKGVISVANHVHMWDYLAIHRAITPNWPSVLVWAANIRGEMSGMIRSVGGIPIPDDNLRGTMKYFDEIKEYLDSGGWLHIYPEGSMWEYYRPIRPFKYGAAYFAVKYNKPIIPLGFSYRKPSWIRRVIFKQIAVFTLNIGEPLYRDPNLPPKEAELDLIKRCHDEVCRLSGIDPEDNIYPPVFDNNERIDYYTKEYGKGYKGSC